MSQFKVEGLTCEYRTSLLGSGVRSPRFGWKLNATARGTHQAAYRVQVSRPGDDFASPLWDTGRVESDRSVQVKYEGPPLQSRSRYEFRVRCWDDRGNDSGWSAPAWWETGLLDSGEWQAKWITPDSEAIDPQAEPAFMLRRSFSLRSGVKSAGIYATAAGLYEIFLNGSRVGEQWMTPGWTSYHHRLQYQTYDVTAQLKSGANGIGVQLADGWYKGRLGWDNKRAHYGDRRALLLQLHVQYDDGSEEVLASDEDWKSSLGPIRFSSIYDGESYDARLEQQGWSEAAFDDSGWSGTEMCELPFEPLVAQENWPVRVTERIYPQKVITTPAGEKVLDLGQNMVGRIRIKFKNHIPEGSTITLQHAEVLDQEGNFYTGNLRSAGQRVEYTAKGGGEVDYTPHFTFQGFRYVKVEGLEAWGDEELLAAFSGEVMHSDMEKTGSFECSDPLVNQLQRNIVWGQRGNFLDVPTDCPQRDERMGWTGDAQVFARTAAFNYHVGPFFGKWVRDLKADQHKDGSVPFVIPNVLEGTAANPGKEQTSAAWGDAAVVCPWVMYLSYGDVYLLEEQYASMKAWVDYIRSQGEQEYLWNTGFHYGDWLGLDAKENSYVGATPLDMVATSFFAYSTRIVRDAAVVLGRAEDVRYYSELLTEIKKAYREEFVTPAGRLAAPTQTAHVLALMFDLVEGVVKQRTARELNELIVKNNYHLTTGFVGTPYLCIVLSDNGYHDTAVKLLLQEEYPSWLYSVKRGATTIWEHWDGIKPDGSFWSDAMNSYNHYAYGAVGDWLYRYVAGLNMNEAEPAYKKILIKPHFAAGQLTSARATLESPYGLIESSWQMAAGTMTVNVQIPVNTSAEIVLQGASMGELFEGGKPAGTAEGVLNISETEQKVTLTVGSGRYEWTYPAVELVKQN
ncbi:family 78 glycoside hydrolase catalytic domain [Paenibacillus medicaginis]|uniref:alpha-L-rhamnosidase n=1 Tax=Paenibacillus medicaginis TaxID=1470560 RepID=A0ABV5BZV5_9BACL